MHHYRSTKKKYNSHNLLDKGRDDYCPFCSEETHDKIIATTETMFVIPNRVKYDLFEGHNVTDHLMVIPKVHRTTVASFSDQERLEMMEVIGRYEEQGYHFFGRGQFSVTRSVDHQHTHLIKISNQQPRVLISLSKPNILIGK